MPWLEQPEGYRPPPQNIYGACWCCACGSRREIREGGEVRLERIFQIHRWLDTTEGPEMMGMGDPGVLAICETCIRDVAKQIGMVTADEHAEAAASAEQLLEAMAKADRLGDAVAEWRARAQAADDRLTERTEQLRLATAQIAAYRDVAAYEQEAGPALRQRIKDLDAELAKLSRLVDSQQRIIDSYQHPDGPRSKRPAVLPVKR